jgi:protein O-mannosyl-transferase
MTQKRWIALALFLLTLFCFGHVCACEFVSWDDHLFVTENPYVLGGLTVANIRWALTPLGGWTPATWLSLQLDATLFGPEAAWGFHLTNLLLHAFSVVLFFHLLERMTGELWPSAICAALFGIHPLRVESVAWVAERRDVLSMLLLLVTVAAYHYYTKRPGWGRYALVALSFALGLAAKPSLVTLPFALLLLDYWPLYRLRLGQTAPAAALALPAVSWRLLILEKAPLLVMALAVSVQTYHFTKQSGGMRTHIPWQDRLAVSLAGYLGYLEKTVWPANLAALYPYRVPPWWVAMFAAVVLLAITTALTYVARRKPMLLVGWLWFVGNLFPVSGVITIGSQALADRYTYLPHLGLFITVVWGVGGLPVWQQASRTLRKVLVSLALVILGMLTWIQVWCWQNTEMLCRHTLSVTENNYRFHVILSGLLTEQGNLKEAEFHIARAVAIAPDDPTPLVSYGGLMNQKEDFQDAVALLEGALRLDRTNAETHYLLGVALDRLGRKEEAKRHLEKSIEFWTSNPSGDLYGKGVSIIPLRKVSPHLLLCEMALREGQPEQGLAPIERALAVKPDLWEGYQFKGIALGRLGRWAEAETALQTALKLNPENAGTRGYLAFAHAHQDKKELAAREYADLQVRFPQWLESSNDFAVKHLTKASVLDPRMAEELAVQMCEATHYQHPRCLDTLGAAQAARGDFSAAQETARKALTLTSDPGLTRRLQERLRLYEDHRALPAN